MFDTRKLLRKWETDNGNVAVRIDYKIHKIDNEQHLVTGVVYSPFVLDSHGHYMTADEIEKTAHAFLERGLQKQVDIMHDNKPISAVVVESYIQREDTEFAQAGSWIATTKINDPVVWERIKRGELNGYSMEVRAFTIEHEAEIEFMAWSIGETMPHSEDGHTHLYLVQMDSAGNVARGFTGQGGTEGHTHSISDLSVTDATNNHTHRIVL